MKTRYTRLSLAEREEISKGIYAREKLSQIAERLQRHPSTVTRKIKRQVKTRRWCYSAVKGDNIAKKNRKKSGRIKKLEASSELLLYIQDKLKQEWSPEEISNRLKIEYPNDIQMRISYESIYQYLYCLPRGELKKELMRGLRRERKQRLSRFALHSRRSGIQDIISISERPEESKGRTVPGHWEGDLIIWQKYPKCSRNTSRKDNKIHFVSPVKKERCYFGTRSFC